MFVLFTDLQPQNEEEKELIQQIVQTEREFLRLFKKVWTSSFFS